MLCGCSRCSHKLTRIWLSSCFKWFDIDCLVTRRFNTTPSSGLRSSLAFANGRLIRIIIQILSWLWFECRLVVRNRNCRHCRRREWSWSLNESIRIYRKKVLPRWHIYTSILLTWNYLGDVLLLTFLMNDCIGKDYNRRWWILYLLGWNLVSLYRIDLLVQLITNVCQCCLLSIADQINLIVKIVCSSHTILWSY